MKTVITMPIRNCRLCGEATWDTVCILGANGDYCRSCADIVKIRAGFHREDQLRKMLYSGNIVLPTENWEPPQNT